jgi:hypothetical protein
MIYTTLRLCKEKHACTSGYKKLKKSLGRDHKSTDLIPLTHVIESNGLQDAIWSFRATTAPCREFITEYALWCAEQVLDIYEKRYPSDNRVRECLEGIVKYQNGEISRDDLLTLRRAGAAYAAADAAYAAADAAYAAAAAADTAYAYAANAAYAAYTAYTADAAADGDMREAQKQKLIEMLNEHEEGA